MSIAHQRTMARSFRERLFEAWHYRIGKAVRIFRDVGRRGGENQI